MRGRLCHLVRPCAYHAAPYDESRNPTDERRYAELTVELPASTATVAIDP